MTSFSGTPHRNCRIHPESPLTRDCRDAFDVLTHALAQCQVDRVTGALRVVGNAGGTFHLRDGAVIAVDSPGSPGAEALLLSSGRISAADWTAALVESVERRCLSGALVGHGVIGSAEVQVAAVAAIQDGAFAVAAGDVERCVVDESIDVPLLSAADGVVPDSLLPETARRLDAVASLAFPLSPYRDRVVPVDGVDSSSLIAERREIIEHATGRRNARDIAFAVGRGLYPVTVEISRMLGEELLEMAPPETSFSFSHWGLGALRPRTEPGPPG